MPLYEFTCQRCGKESEILVRRADWTSTSCPHCGSKKLQKKLSVFASTGSDSGAGDELLSCSGNPSACGRCQGGN